MNTKKETDCLSQNLQKKTENFGKLHMLRKKNSVTSETQDAELLMQQRKQPKKQSVKQNLKLQRKQDLKQEDNQHSKDRCFIPLLHSNDPYFVKRREEINKELAEHPVDFEVVMKAVLRV